MRYRIKLYLYRPHDIDLLFCDKENFINQAAYICLKAFVKNEFFRIHIPDGPCSEPKRRSHQYLVELNVDKDKDIISMWENIPMGTRNNFLKNILRMYLLIPTDIYQVSPEHQNFFTSRFLNLFKTPDVYIEEKMEEYGRKQRKKRKANRERKKYTQKRVKERIPPEETEVIRVDPVSIPSPDTDNKDEPTVSSDLEQELTAAFDSLLM